jgi:sirohydrochlorin ferrochelatase
MVALLLTLPLFQLQAQQPVANDSKPVALEDFVVTSERVPVAATSAASPLCRRRQRDRCPPCGLHYQSRAPLVHRPPLARWLVRPLIALFFFLPGLLQAQTGLLVVAHGADSGWNARVRETVAQVHWNGPVATAFLMGSDAATQGWNTGVDSLIAKGARRLVVVPLMVSTYGGHVRQIEFYAGVRDSLPAALMGHEHGTHEEVPVPVTVTGALDAAPELRAALEARWHELNEADRKRPILLVAHGPNDSIDAAHWLANLGAAGQALAASARADARVMLLRDDAPADVRAAAVAAMRDTVMVLSRRAADSVVVMPVMISSGTITKVKIPHDLTGLPIRYHPRPLAPLPMLARWIERQGLGARD